MNFKIDENLPTEITGILLNNGYIATTVYDENITGCSDKVLAEICKKDNKALITLDLDFSDIRTYKPADYSGIIILRLQYQDKPYI